MKEQIPEHELVALLQSGDKRALEYLYDNYSAALFGILKRICRDHHTAEDLLQDSFTRIWLSRASYDNTKGTLFTWMLTIARRLGIDRIRSGEFRKQSVNQSLEALVDMDVIGSEQPFMPETSDMKQLVATLPAEQKQIIDLMYFHGFSQSEIAEEFDIPLGTVKSRSRMALTALRKFFTSQE